MASPWIGRCLRSTRTTLRTLSHRQPASCPHAAQLVAQQSLRHFSTTLQVDARKYTKEHEWIDLKADGKTGTVGISEFAAEQLGDVVYVELPATGTKYKFGDAMGAIESVKSAADITAPISCSVAEVNTLLEETPSTINKLPEDDSNGGGWLARVDVDEQGRKDMEKLMTDEEYKAWIASESVE